MSYMAESESGAYYVRFTLSRNLEPVAKWIGLLLASCEGRNRACSSEQHQ